MTELRRTPRRPGFARRLGPTLLILACSLGAAATAQGLTNDADAAALRASQAAVGRVASGYRLVDSHNRPLDLAEFRGRPLVLSFVYTNCYAICSGMTLHLREVVRVARAALGAQSFSVITVGFDTSHDTPARMLAYGRDRGIVDPGWHFASADAATIRRMTDDMGFTWSESPRGFDHITQVTVLDGAGRVAQQVYGQDFAPPELVEPLKQLLLGRSVERTSVRGLIERVRLYCSVYDPATGRYRFDVTMFAGVIPAIMVLGIIAMAVVFAGRKSR